MKTLGLVTIGQAPRTDVTPDFAGVVAGIHLVETGALDELSARTIQTLAPTHQEQLLVSRMRDGSQVVVSEHRVQPFVQQAVDRAVEQGAQAILVICTGALPDLHAPVPVFGADQVARGGTVALVGQDCLGVMVPEEPQIPAIRHDWEQRLNRKVRITAADPYTASLEELTNAAVELADRGAQWIFLDCIGYSEAMADAMRERCPGVQVLTARMMAARLVVAAL